MAGGAILRRGLPRGGLHKGAAVGLGVEGREEAIGAVDPGVLAGCEPMQGRVLNLKVAVSHAAAHVDDRVAGYASKAVLRFRSFHLIFDGLVEAAVEENGVIMTAGAPFAAAGSAQ